jgi:hypothetical protein
VDPDAAGLFYPHLPRVLFRPLSPVLHAPSRSRHPVGAVVFRVGLPNPCVWASSP